MQAKYKVSLWALIVAFALASVAWLPAAEKSDPGEKDVAVVNGTRITRADFDREMKLAEASFSKRGQAPTDSELAGLRDKVLDRLIRLELLYQESKKTGIKVDEAKIDNQWVALQKRFSEDELKSMLSRMNLSEADVRFQMGRAMAIQEFVQVNFIQKVTVSEDEMKAYYDSHPDLFKQREQVRASHILVSVDSEKGESGKTESRKKIESIQQKLGKGQDFSALAKEFSKCPSSAKGGDLGYFGRGQMVKPFEEAAFSLKPGQVSDVVETQFGYHLIKVTDKKAETILPFDDVKDKIGQSLKQQKVEKEIDRYVEKLMGKAKIERALIGDG